MYMYYATAKEMEKLDALAVKKNLTILQMMELAGWHMVSLFRKIKISKKSKIVIVVGKGNKGGDGLSAARHLLNNGWDVSVVLLSRRMSESAEHHLRIIKRIGVPVYVYSKSKAHARRMMKRSDIVIDALIGYHLNGAPRGLFKEVIECMNNSGKKIIAYDLPSGLDATNGKCFAPCVRAYATLSLALPKRAHNMKYSKTWCGMVFVADIGIPKCFYNTIHSKSRPRFEHHSDGLMPLPVE